MKIVYPRDELWESVFYHTIDLALNSLGRVVPEMRHVWEPVEYLRGATYPGNSAAVKEGATYKSLAYVAHRFGMSDDERRTWYSIATRLSLSQAHIGAIIARLNERDELYADLDKFAMSA